MDVDQTRTQQINTTSNLDLSTERQAQRPAADQAAATRTDVELLFDEDRLRIYYERIFPYKLMFKWISYGKMVQRDR